MVERTPTLERALRAPSKVIVLVAPAGFGKSFVAREIAAASAAGTVEVDLAEPGARESLARLDERIASSPPAATIVLDSLEAAGEDAEALGAFGRAIRAKGARTIVLASRPPFPLLNTRALPPGSHLRLGPEELSLTPDEVRAACAGFEGAAHEAIYALSLGWPFAVPALAGGAAPGDLHEYLYNEVVSAVPAALRAVLIATHAAGARGLAAVGIACGRSDASNALAQLAAVVPVVQRADGTPALHPLLADVVATRCAEEVDKALRRTASSGGAVTVAAAVAANAASGTRPSPSPHDLFEQACRDREALPADADLDTVRALDARSAFFALEAGEFEFGQRVLLPYADALLDEPPAAGDALLLAAQGYLHALRYQPHQARTYYNRALPCLESKGIAATILASLAGFARLEGDREGELAALDHAQRLARECEDRAPLAEVLVHRIYGAWFCGDEIDYQRCFAALEEALSADRSERFFAPFSEALRERSVDVLSGKLTPRWRAYAGLLVASGLKDAESVEAALVWAQGEAAHCADLLGELLALLARALAVPARHDELQGRISVLALKLDLPLLTQALEALFAGSEDETILTAFARRFAVTGSGGAAKRAAPGNLRINALTGTISRGDRSLHLSNRPLALVLSLAILGAVPRERLCEALWPDSDDVSAANTLKMCVRRARQQLDDPSAIVYDHSLWSLRDDVVVDIVEIERNLRTIATAGPLPAKNRTYLEAIFEFLERTRPPEIYKSEGMESVGLRVGKIRHLTVARLGEDALQREDLPAALRYADVLRHWDPTDESSYTISIRAYAAGGNEAEAYREYRQYSAQCERELGIKPDLSLNELLKQLAPR
jgi:DNA-binding SARP family transcriptional activator